MGANLNKKCAPMEDRLDSVCGPLFPDIILPASTNVSRLIAGR